MKSRLLTLLFLIVACKGTESVAPISGGGGPVPLMGHVIALLSDVVNSATQRNNLVPFSQFAADLAGGNLPAYSFVVPNLCNDAHDCSLSTADQWLQTNIDPLVKNAAFQRDGLLVIVFD